jgi:hypothetical protein
VTKTISSKSLWIDNKTPEDIEYFSKEDSENVVYNLQEDILCLKDKIAELEKELEAAMTFNVDVIRCLSRIASVENHNEVPAYIDMSRRCIKTIEAKQAKALKEQE